MALVVYPVTPYKVWEDGDSLVRGDAGSVIGAVMPAGASAGARGKISVYCRWVRKLPLLPHTSQFSHPLIFLFEGCKFWLTRGQVALY